MDEVLLGVVSLDDVQQDDAQQPVDLVQLVYVSRWMSSTAVTASARQMCGKSRFFQRFIEVHKAVVSRSICAKKIP